MNAEKTILELSLTAKDGRLYAGRTGSLVGTLKNKAGQQYHCRSICLGIPVGNEENQLYLNDNKTVIASRVKTWNAVLLEETEALGENIITLKLQQKDGGLRPLTTPLEFEVTGNLNLVPGSATVTYTYEYNTDGGKQWNTETAEYVFEKTTDTLYLRNFLTVNPLSPLNPCTQFGPGESIYFSWEGNGTNYEIYQKGETTPIYSGQETHFTYQKGIDADTTFLLKAVHTDNALAQGEAGHDGLTSSGEMLFETITLTSPKPVFSEVTVQDGFFMQKGPMSFFHKAIQMERIAEELQTKSYVKVQVNTDGILAVYLTCETAESPSSAYLRFSTYHDNECQCTGEDYAFRADLQAMPVAKAAHIVMPIAKGDIGLLQCIMKKPAQQTLAKGYRLQCYFFPFGQGEAKIL